MFRRFTSLSNQPAYVRVWAFYMFGLYAFWSLLLVMIPFGFDHNIDHADALRLYVAAWVVVPILAGGATLMLLARATPPPQSTRLRLTTNAWALTGYNTAATTAFLLASGSLATHTDLHLYLLPFVLVFVGFNALVLWWGSLPEYAAAWWAFCAGILTVCGGVTAALLPIDTATQVGNAHFRIASPGGRIITENCQTLNWRVRDIDNPLFFSVFEGWERQTVPEGSALACRDYTIAPSRGDGQYYLRAWTPIGVEHVEDIALNVLHRDDVLPLALAALSVLAAPPLLVRTRTRWLTLLLAASGGVLFAGRVVTWEVLAVALVLSPAAYWLYARADIWLAGRALRRGLDAATLVLIPLVTINTALPTNRFQVNFWLGPVNEVAQGKTLFVDASSQYGIGSTYFLAWLFQLTPLPLTYSGFALLAYALTAAITALLFVLLRRLLATWTAPALFVAVCALLLVWRSTWTVSSHPVNGPMHAVFQYVLLGLVALRLANRRRAWAIRRLEAGAACLAFIWSFEAWVFAWVPFIGSLLFTELVQGRSWRFSAKRLGKYLASMTLGSAALLGGFMALGYFQSGTWPDLRVYGWYLTSDARVGTPFQVYLPYAFAVAASFGTLAAVLFKLAARPQDRARLVPYTLPVMVALIGAVQLAYWVRAPYLETLAVAVIPAVFLGAYWLGRLPQEPLPASVQRGGTAVLLFGVLAIGVGHVAAPPITTPAEIAVQWLWRGASNPLAAEAPAPYVAEALDLISTYSPDEERLAVFLSPDDTVETLLRAEAAHVWRMSNPAMAVQTGQTSEWVQDYTGYTPQLGDYIYAQAGNIGLNYIQARILERIEAQIQTEVVATSPAGIEARRVIAVRRVRPARP